MPKLPGKSKVEHGSRTVINDKLETFVVRKYPGTVLQTTTFAYTKTHSSVELEG